MPAPSPVELPDEPPPFLGSWRNVYALVLIVLALDVLILTIFTKAFA